MMVKLLFDPALGSWSVLSDSNHWSVNEDDALKLASFMRLEIKDPAMIRATSGFAELLALSNDRASVRMVDHSGDPEGVTVELLAGSVSLADATWVFGRYDDNWLSVEAELRWSKTSEIGFRLFLPDLVGLREKQVSILNGDTSIDTFVVPRDIVTDHWVSLPADSSNGYLTVLSSYAEPAKSLSEMRDLGVLVVGINLDHTGWISK